MIAENTLAINGSTKPFDLLRRAFVQRMSFSEYWECYSDSTKILRAESCFGWFAVYSRTRFRNSFTRALTVSLCLTERPHWKQWIADHNWPCRLTDLIGLDWIQLSWTQLDNRTHNRDQDGSSEWSENPMLNFTICISLIKIHLKLHL